MSKKKPAQKDMQTGYIIGPEDGFRYEPPLGDDVQDFLDEDPIIPFTGIARTVVASDTNKTFRNFRIHTLHIENGRVIKVDKSDAYVNFETISKLELMNEISIMHLDMNWKDGKALQK